MAPPTWVWEGTSTASTSTAAVPYPVSGVVANDIPLIVCVSKASSGTGEPPAISDPSGFTKLFEAWGGIGTAGAGTGPVKLTVWKKTTDATGSENGTTVSVVNPAGSAMVYCNIHGVRRATAGSTIQTAFASGSDVSAGTAWSVTCGSNPGITTDDLCFWLAGATVNTSGTFTVQAITATGCTFGTMTERDDDGSNTGFGTRRVVATMACTAGPSSAAPVLTATSASSSQSGVGALLRIREVAGGQTIAANQTVETETAQTVGKLKTRPAAQTVEAETAQTVTARKTAVAAQALEAEAAQPITVVQRWTITANQVVEAETAQPVGKAKSKAATQPAEVETAQPVTARKTITVGQAVETEAAQPVQPAGPKIITVGQVVEAETAQTLVRVKARTLAHAAEAEAAQTLTHAKTALINLAVETETAQPVSSSVVIIWADGTTVHAQANTGPVTLSSATGTTSHEPANPTPAGVSAASGATTHQQASSGQGEVM